MMNQRLKPVALAVALATAGGLSACAGTGGQDSVTGKGAAAGGVIGGLLGYTAGGDEKAAVIGAVLGAVIGNYIEHQQVRSSQQVYAKHGQEEKVVLNDVQLSRRMLQPGQEAEAMVKYDVVAPDADAAQPVTHTMDYYHGESRLASNQQTVEVVPGGYETVFPVVVPEGAEEGDYRLVARVESPNAADRKEAAFRVTYARNDRGVLHVAGVTAE